MVFKTEQVSLDIKSLSWLLSIVLISVAGYWYIWQWYFNRVKSSPEEAIGLLAIFAFMLFWCVRTISRRHAVFKFSLWPISLLLFIYSISFFLPVPSIVKSAVAFLTLFLTIYWASFGSHPPLSFWGLVIISLPVVPSLQFYLGYPARYLSASATVFLLQLNGVSVSQSATNLVWNNQLIQFDAPCSGVTMLWAGLLVTLFISFVYRFSLFKTGVAVFVACLLVLFGNILRGSSLFYLEIGAIPFKTPWLHEGIGLGAFAFVTIGIVVTLSKFQQWSITK
ncbi:MAG: archaeosortase/exosortase family protein [Candidatus Thiodiazotropha sp.]|jgi:exosortase/archaeosortase family protein